jgi:Cys-tRNA(Pro) deacylase
MKTNGARFLESLGISFEIREYDVDPNDLSAITVAKKIGMPAEQVFKTLLVTGGPNIYRFAVIPGDAELDFKKLARAAGLRKAEMAPLKDVQPLTGYIRGGLRCSAHASPTRFISTRRPFCLTRSASRQERAGRSSFSRPTTTSAPPRHWKWKCRRRT